MYMYVHVLFPSRVLSVVLGVHTADHIHRASLTDAHSTDEGLWSFLRLVGMCPQQMSTIMLGHFPNR